MHTENVFRGGETVVSDGGRAILFGSSRGQRGIALDEIPRGRPLVFNQALVFARAIGRCRALALRSLGSAAAVAVIGAAVWLAAAVAPAPAADGQLDKSPAKVKAAEVHRPTPLPDRIILTFAGDPATTMAVTWRTSTDVTTAFAEIVPAGPGPNFPKGAQRVAARTEALATDLNKAHFHSVQFEGLQPATKYAYRVGDGENFSEWFQFTTAGDRPEPFEFLYFGDAQNDIRTHWSRVVREAFRDAPKARFAIHAGDLVNRGDSDAAWGEWFQAGGWLNAMIPSVPVPGNHDQAKNSFGLSGLTPHWRAQFTLPEHGPSGVEETCYTLVYQGVRIIALDSNRQIEAQTRWLTDVLQANKAHWVICTFHHPIFSTAKARDNAALRAAWKPAFDRFRVDLVLQGHDHTYGRTGLDTPPAKTAGATATTQSVGNSGAAAGFEATDRPSTRETPQAAESTPSAGLANRTAAATGTVYVVSVSGPKMYSLQPEPMLKRTAENTQLYQIIRVEGDTLRFEARTAVGELYDAFLLRKRPGEVNELVEQGPAAALRPRTVSAAGSQ